MRDESDDAVTARLWAVLSCDPLPGRSVPVAAVPPPLPAAASAGEGSFADRGPVAWSELLPSWPDDADLPDDGPPRPVATASSTAPIDPSAWAIRPAWRASTAAPDPPIRAFDAGAEPDAPIRGFEVGAEPPVPDRPPSAGAFGRAPGRLSAFDPGRRGAGALIAVAAVVVLIAAFLAWRARPQVEPVPVPPGAEAAGTAVPGDVGPAAAGAAPGDVGPAAAGAAPGDVGPAAAGSAGPQLVVAVEGKVGRPGVVRLPAGSRVADALAAAGGARSGVDVSLLNLARKVVDGELILVGVTPPPGAAVAPGPAGPAPGGAPAGPVNLNTATVADLDTLPGVGPVLAQRILDARTAQGGFRAVSDLRKVDGIGASRYEQLKDLVTV